MINVRLLRKLVVSWIASFLLGILFYSMLSATLKYDTVNMMKSIYFLRRVEPQG